MTFLHYFEGREARLARERAAALELLVALAKRAERASENRLREKIDAAGDLVRSPIAGALVWRGGDE